MVDLENTLLNTPAGAQWRRIGIKHHHGIALPLFSLHTKQSCGIGEYADLIPLIHWCKEIGIDIIQLLPLNDMGLGTSPYNAISAFALSPLYLNLTTLPYMEKVPNFQERLNQLRYWNKTPRVKYHVVRESKLSFLREYFRIAFNEISETNEYKSFIEQNNWIQPYSLFKAIKESQMWKSWEEWPTQLKSPSESGYQELAWQFSIEAQLHEFIQFLCFQQMEHVKRVADQNGVLLKGDIPILISKDSADVWRHRQYFLLNLSAGAPPDMYSKDGQNWGFPIYDWEELEKDHYSWWRQRLRIASHLFHLYRIDHVVGFFRIWTIPFGKIAREGSFLPQNEEEWIPHGTKLMKMMLAAAPILPIGEDLGLVPPEVKKCLYALGICGTKMMRWERYWDTDGSYIPVSKYQPMTMTTVSTHDSDTLQLWWRHYPKEAKLFCEFKHWDYKPFLSPERQKEILKDSHHSASLFHINLFQEYLAMFPELVALNPNFERINVPGRELETNWTYRFRPSLEEILAHTPLRLAIRSILKG